MAVSIYGGTGNIGSYYHGLYGGDIIDRDWRTPKSNKVLYFISTTSNNNIFLDATLDVKTNLLDLTERLDACKKAGITEFNFISSWFVYGKPFHVRFHEDDYCNPKGFYSITKKAAEDLVVDYCKTFRINYRILRLCDVYGSLCSPKAALNSQRNLIHQSIESLKQNKEVILFDGVKRDLMHAYDVCRAINTIIEKGKFNIVYNVGSNTATSYLSTLEYAKNILGSSSKLSSVECPGTYEQALHFYLACGRLHSLGFYPMIDIHEGIKDLCLEQKFCTPDRILMDPKFKLPLTP